MAKKRIVKVDIYNQESNEKAFYEGFLKALRTDGITIENNNIYMEVSDRIYVADVQEFAFVWQPTIN